MHSEQLFAPRFSISLPEPPTEASTGSPAGRAVGLVKIWGRAPGPYTLSWLERGTSGIRRRTMRSTWSRAKRAADVINTALTNTRVALDQLDEAAAAEYLRCRDLAARFGRSAESMLQEFVDLMELLEDRGTPRQAIEFFRDHHHKDGQVLPVPELIDLFLGEKKDEISSDFYNHLAKDLELFAGHFTGPLHPLSAAQISTWLNGLKARDGSALGPRTRHNKRANVDQFIRWAQANNYLSRTWSEMEFVKDPGTKFGRIQIWTPGNLTRLLLARQHSEQAGRARKKSLMPFITLQAFAGIRHEELCPTNPRKEPLDWRNVHLPQRYLYIPAETSKTGIDRTVPIANNLVEWLEPYARRSGRVCELENASSALTRAKKDAELPAGRNESRNVLRKSFISYRLATVKHIGQVAEEAGNSPGIIRKHYRKILPAGEATAAAHWPLGAEAQAWFAICPTTADIVQLNFAFK